MFMSARTCPAASAWVLGAPPARKPPVAIWGTKQAIHYTRDHSTDDALRQMGWLQAGIWSNAHVREAVTAMKAKRGAEFPALAALVSFRDAP